jgi:hypothetical protein
MISYILPDRALTGVLPATKAYGQAGGKLMAFSAPADEWPDRAGIGRRIIKPHCGPVKAQQFNDCTANMATGLVETVRAQQGLPYVELSATALYAHINGGRDVGSNLHDAANHVAKVGCVPVSMWPANTWRMKNPAGYAETAARFRGLEWIEIPDGAGVITGVGWYGRPVGIGVRWGAGGHAIQVIDYGYRARVPGEHLRAYADLVRHYDQVNSDLAELCGAALDGDQVWFEIENSWGKSYGENGYGWLPWSQVDSGVRTRYGGICVTSVAYTMG